MKDEKKVVKLALVRKRKEAEKRHEVFDHLVSVATTAENSFPAMRGFAIVTWGDNGEYTTNWYIGDMNPLLLPELVKNALTSTIYPEN